MAVADPALSKDSHSMVTLYVTIDRACVRFCMMTNLQNLFLRLGACRGQGCLAAWADTGAILSPTGSSLQRHGAIALPERGAPVVGNLQTVSGSQYELQSARDQATQFGPLC